MKNLLKIKLHLSCVSIFHLSFVPLFSSFIFFFLFSFSLFCFFLSFSLSLSLFSFSFFPFFLSFFSFFWAGWGWCRYLAAQEARSGPDYYVGGEQQYAVFSDVQWQWGLGLRGYKVGETQKKKSYQLCF
jgi:hypothetical protein